MKLLPPVATSEKLGGTEPATLANWRSQGIGPPYVKVGGRVYYPEHLLDEWIQSRIQFADLSEYMAGQAAPVRSRSSAG